MPASSIPLTIQFIDAIAIAIAQGYILARARLTSHPSPVLRLAAQRHDSLAAGLVQTVIRQTILGFGHVSTPLIAKDGTYRLSASSWASLPDAGRYAKSRVRRRLFEMGDTGLEPVTSRV